MKRGPIRASSSKSQAGREKTTTVRISSGSVSVKAKASIKTK